MNVVLVMFRENGDRRSFSLSRDVTIIGRREDADFRIPLTDVSRKHCRLMKDGNSLLIEDLGSANGTFHNGRKVSESEVQPGDTLQIGPIQFVVQIDGVPSEQELLEAGGAAKADSSTGHLPGESHTPPPATVVAGGSVDDDLEEMLTGSSMVVDSLDEDQLLTEMSDSLGGVEPLAVAESLAGVGAEAGDDTNGSRSDSNAIANKKNAAVEDSAADIAMADELIEIEPSAGRGARSASSVDANKSVPAAKVGGNKSSRSGASKSQPAAGANGEKTAAKSSAEKKKSGLEQPGREQQHRTRGVEDLKVEPARDYTQRGDSMFDISTESIVGEEDIIIDMGDDDAKK